jgi:cytochrome o ubiquinol oxidase operon protein cyoD
VLVHRAISSTWIDLDAAENLVAIVFTAILIFLMVGGSFWIMFDLHNRMAM